MSAATLAVPRRIASLLALAIAGLCGDAMAQAHAAPERHGHASQAQAHAMAMPDRPSPHDGHAMPETRTDPPASASADQPRTPIPALTDADRAAAAPPPGGHALHAMHDDLAHSFISLDRLETWDADPGAGIGWEGEAWFGTDRDRLWLRSEGEGSGGHVESADIEALYGRAIAPWWDAVVGVRHDFKPGDAQDFAAIGVIGLAPYKFEVAATAYVGASGRTMARVEIEYETLLTNRLILQPLLEADFNGRDDPRRATGSGLSTLEAGLRLRYEIDRRFAPYVGIVRERAYGHTAEFRRDRGEDAADTRVVIGIHLWF